MIVIDWGHHRLEFVRSYDPAEVHDYRGIDDMAVFIKKLTDGFGADVCIGAVGADASGNARHILFGKMILIEAGSAIPLHWAINSVKKGGIVFIVDVYGPTGTMIPIGNVVNKGIKIRANQASVKRLFPRLIRQVQAGRIDPKALDPPRPA